MGVTPDRLAEIYPRLYHMAEDGSWESIRRHGLLSTSALLDLFGITGREREELEERRRPESREITTPEQGRAVIRDQKPIVESKLEGALEGCTLQQWYRTLNSRVFFWLTLPRLHVLLSAREYRDRPHTVLTLETAPLARDLQPAVTLSPMNSGNTQPFAHKRGPATFKRMQDYPFEERRGRGLYYQVVELAVDHGVRNIDQYVVSVKTMVSDGEAVRSVGVIWNRG